MNDRVRIEVDGHVATVILDRADKYNALDLKMFAAIGEAADSVAKNGMIRAVVLTGEGDNFCAGIDTGMFSERDVSIGASLKSPIAPSAANLYQRAAYAWRELPVPVVCAVRGITYGGGLQIALGADLRIASPDARFSIMEVEWGLIPDMAISTTLRNILPADRVKELAWSARVINAEEALEYGIVTAVEDDPRAAATTLAKKYAARSPGAVRGIKRLVNEAWQLSEVEALALEAEVQLGVIGSPNQMEAVLANVQNRLPEFED